MEFPKPDLEAAVESGYEPVKDQLKEQGYVTFIQVARILREKAGIGIKDAVEAEEHLFRERYGKELGWNPERGRYEEARYARREKVELAKQFWKDLATEGRYPVYIIPAFVEKILEKASDAALEYMANGRERIGEEHYVNHLTHLQKASNRYCDGIKEQIAFFQALFGEGFTEDHWENMRPRVSKARDQIVPEKRRVRGLDNIGV